LIQTDILAPGPAAPLAASATAPFLFEGSNPQFTNLVYPFLISSNGELTNSEPPSALASTPVALVVATGTALAPVNPAVVFEPASVNFNPIQVGQSLTAQITLYSTGSAPLTINSISILGDPSFSETNNCPASLAPSSSCNIQATFAPQSPGTFTATLNLFGNVSGSVPLSGNPPAPPPAPNFTLSATPTSV
jgi:hypothetical protein